MKNQFGQNTNENISALEVYYFKVNTKRESMFCLQEDRLCFVTMAINDLLCMKNAGAQIAMDFS